MDNQEETDTFLETYNIPRLNKEEKENMNGQIASNKTEFEKNSNSGLIPSQRIKIPHAAGPAMQKTWV